MCICCRSQWPRGLRRRPAAARMLRSLVRIPPGTWMFVCCERCVLSGRDLCDELITRPEESYRLCCVIVCDLENSRMRRPWPALGRSATKKMCICWWMCLKYITVLVSQYYSSNIAIHRLIYIHFPGVLYVNWIFHNSLYNFLWYYNM
jgi:hypothetical protein